MNNPYTYNFLLTNDNGENTRTDEEEGGDDSKIRELDPDMPGKDSDGEGLDTEFDPDLEFEEEEEE